MQTISVLQISGIVSLENRIFIATSMKTRQIRVNMFKNFITILMVVMTLNGCTQYDHGECGKLDYFNWVNCSDGILLQQSSIKNPYEEFIIYDSVFIQLDGTINNKYHDVNLRIYPIEFLKDILEKNAQTSDSVYYLTSILGLTFEDISEHKDSVFNDINMRKKVFYEYHDSISKTEP
jgi:hypothetical protein